MYNGGTTNAANTPLGLASGNVVLNNAGDLKIGGYAGANQKPIIKNDLSFNGSGYVDIDSGDGSGSPTALQLTALTRNNRSVLYLEGQRGRFGNTTGGYEQITVANPDSYATSDGAMVSPVYTSAERFTTNGQSTGYYYFLNYGATGTVGFSYAPYTVGGSATGGSGGQGIVTSAADWSSLISADIAAVTTPVSTASSGTTVQALMTTANIGGTGTLTVTSGGIINDATVTYGCPVAFGGAEGIVYTRNGNVYMTNGISGTNGLTKAGAASNNPYGLFLSTNSSGAGTNNSATLSGPVTVDEGMLCYGADNQLGSTDTIYLNGGGISFVANGTSAMKLSLGPAGGTLYDGAVRDGLPDVLRRDHRQRHPDDQQQQLHAEKQRQHLLRRHARKRQSRRHLHRLAGNRTGQHHQLSDLGRQ